MWEIEKLYKVKLGGNYFVNCENLISYDGTPIFSLERQDTDQRLGINFIVCDENGKKTAFIHRGKVVQGDADRFDIFHGSDCDKVIDKATGRIIVQVGKYSHETELSVSVNTHLPGTGFMLEATPDSINISGTFYMTGCRFVNLDVGIAIGESSERDGIRLPKPRNLHPLSAEEK